MNGKKEIHLAMPGMIEGNRHPYSSSAIENGYDPAEMAKCRYTSIPGARVTHIWTDDPADAPKVARASLIEHIAALHDVYGCLGAVHLYGTKGDRALKLMDTYSAFRAQLVAFIEMLRTGKRPLPFAETAELIAVIIAGIRSRQQGGVKVAVAGILRELQS